jgi:uncharacterized membrane protein
MEKKIKAILIATLLTVFVLALIVWGLWSFASKMEHDKLALWAILATFLLPCFFWLGFWFGKTEVRGFLSGFDTSLDKLANAVSFRDDQRVSTAQRMTTREPVSYPVFQPQITNRASHSDEIIDL